MHTPPSSRHPRRLETNHRLRSGTNTNTSLILSGDLPISDAALRKQLIRLAHTNPEMRPHVLSLLCEAGTVKKAQGSGAANAVYLNQSPLKDKILRAVAKHYGISVSAMEAELTDPDAEAVYEYIGNDPALRMQVYRDFKSKGLTASVRRSVG